MRCRIFQSVQNTTAISKILGLLLLTKSMTLNDFERPVTTISHYTLVTLAHIVPSKLSHKTKQSQSSVLQTYGAEMCGRGHTSLL